MDEGQSEAVRLRAAVEILDRSGIRGGVEIRSLPVHESPAEKLQHRLATLSRRMSEARERELPVSQKVTPVPSMAITLPMVRPAPIPARGRDVSGEIPLTAGTVLPGAWHD